MASSWPGGSAAETFSGTVSSNLEANLLAMSAPSTARPSIPADRPVELERGGGYAHQSERDGVLNREGEGGEGRAESDAQHDDVPDGSRETGAYVHRGDEERAHDHDSGADDGLRAVVAAGPGEKLAGEGSAEDDSEHHGSEEAAAACGGRAKHALEEERHEDYRAEHSKSGEEGGEERDRYHPVSVYFERHDGGFGPGLYDYEGDAHGQAEGEESYHLGRTPCVLHAAPGEGEQDGSHREYHCDHAGVVELSAFDLGGYLGE